jgi:alpha-1,3-rhamnosyl/mannosyltransferase
MKVGISNNSLLKRSGAFGYVDGIGVYTRELIKALNQLSCIDQISQLHFQNFSYSKVNDDNYFEIGDFRLQTLLSVLFATNFYSERLIPSLDIFHSTDHLIPKFKTIPVVSTIHDTVPLSNPEWCNPSMRKIKNIIFKNNINWAAHIITISEFSKYEILKYHNIDASNITVIYNGVGEEYFSRVSEASINTIKQKYRLPKNFILFIGTFQPRKNIVRIIKAHNLLEKAMRFDFPLVIMGGGGWSNHDVINEILNASDSVVWLKEVTDFEKIAVLQSATAFVFPSLYEGFGLPILEAFACEVPVVTSNTTSMPEIAGDAAILVDPYEIDSIKFGIEQVINNVSLRRDLARKGLVRARLFTWINSAIKTFSIYKRVYDEKN